MNGQAAYAEDPDDVGAAILVSPPVALGGVAAQLIFRHRYNLESPGGQTAYDGGVLEMKIGGGNYMDILAAGGSFASNGYNTSIIAEGNNPLSARRAWSGDQRGRHDRGEPARGGARADSAVSMDLRDRPRE